MRFPSRTNYRGRLAPSPTGYLHLGHARTFWIAQERCQQHEGTLILRNEDLDRSRVRPEFSTAMLEDLGWFGFRWQEGPDCGGAYGPYLQSERMAEYRDAINRLAQEGFVYPCRCSRKDVLNATAAPHDGEEEPLYPGTCRPHLARTPRTADVFPPTSPPKSWDLPSDSAKIAWRFRVPDGELLTFVDGLRGPQQFVAGRDFGDFVVWRFDGMPSYQLAVVVDDAAMHITEVVRGEDLLVSTARQLLLYRALGFQAPSFYHCPLLTDESGRRLAKRHDAQSLRALRESGYSPAQLRARSGLTDHIP